MNDIILFVAYDTILISTNTQRRSSEPDPYGAHQSEQQENDDDRVEFNFAGEEFEMKELLRQFFMHKYTRYAIVFLISGLLSLFSEYSHHILPRWQNIVVIFCIIYLVFFIYTRLGHWSLVKYLSFENVSAGDRLEHLLKSRGWKRVTFEQCRKIVKYYPEAAFVIRDEESYRYLPRYKEGCPKFLLSVARLTKKERARLGEEFASVDHYSWLFKSFLIIMVILVVSIFILAKWDQRALVMWILFFIVSLPIIYGLILLNLMRVLKSKGYHWITLHDSMDLLHRTGLKSFAIPSKCNVETLPNYNDYDMLSLVLLARTVK